MLCYSCVMKTGLIIQGPIHSPGFGPYEFIAGGKFEKSWIDYDSKENIKSILVKSLNLFDVIALVTWRDPRNRDFLEEIRIPGKILVFEVDEDTFLINKRIEGTHKYHQIYSTHIGAQKLKTLGVHFIAKIRTDQSIDLILLSKLVKDHSRRNPRSVGVPYLNLFEIDRLTDFYFVGDCQLIENLCEYFLASPELFKDTHKDYFYKFSHFLNGRVCDVQNANQRLFRFHQMIKNVADWTQVLYPLDPRLLEDFYWRGRKVNIKLNGWVRYFFVFHATSSSQVFLKTISNWVQTSLARSARRPFIKVLSFFSYRKHRIAHLKNES